MYSNASHVGRLLCLGMLALVAASPSTHGQSATGSGLNEFARALQAEIGDSVEVSIEPSQRMRIAPNGQVVLETTRYLALEFPTRRFTMKDKPAQYAYLGRVVPRARRIAGSLSDSLGLTLSLQLGVDSSSGGEQSMITMAQGYQWPPGKWPTDSATIAGR